MRPLVTVVIPAHNPGRYVEPCIRSLLRQTLPRDRFEVVFVDDGSTDGTGERLNRLAREQPHIRVIHIPASGGPGRPRNVGLGAALGEYVQFLDADDELAPRALERLHRMARANRSDIVLGKFASQTMSRRQDLFTRNRRACTIADTPQLADASMGPTKMFRTAFLREHELMFPEGWRQMEDQAFTLSTYLQAQVISILGDEPAYYFNKREDEGHISSELVDPSTHVAHLAEIFDTIDRDLPEGPLRDRFIGRFYRLEMLGRLTGEQFLVAPYKFQVELFTGLRDLALERAGLLVLGGLGAIARIRSQLLLDGRLSDLLGLEVRLRAFTVDARIDTAAWRNGRLAIDYTAVVSRGSDGHPLVVVARDGGTFLDPDVGDDLVGPVDVADELGSIRAQVSVVDRETALEWVVPGAAGLALRGAPNGDIAGRSIPTLVGLVEVDPQRVGPGERSLDDGSWDVVVRWSGLGLRSTGPLRLPKSGRRGGRREISAALLGRPLRWAVPRRLDDGGLRISVGGPDRLPAHIDRGGIRVIRDGAGVAIRLPIAADRTGTLARARLRLSGTAGTLSLPARLEGSGGFVVLVSERGAAGGIVRTGRYELTGHLGSEDAPGMPVGGAIVRDDGRLVMLGLPRLSGIERLQSMLHWTAGSLRDAARSRALGLVRRLPQPTRDAIRSFYGRLRG